MQIKGKKIFLYAQKYGNTSRLPAFRLCNSKESFKNMIGLTILKNYSFKISRKKTSRKMHTFFIWQLLINIMKLFINEFCSYVSLRFLPQGLVTMSKRTYSAMLFSRSRYILKNWPTPGCHFSQITLMESIKSVWLKEKSAVKF